MRRKTFLWEIPLALVVGILFAAARGGNFFYSSLLRSTDFLHGETSPGGEIIIVAIDDTSVAQYGSWPWPHTIHAQIIEKLDQARVIGIDILFDEVGDPVLLDAFSETNNIVLAQIGVFSEKSAPGIITPPPARFICPINTILSLKVSGGTDPEITSTYEITGKVPVSPT